MAKVAGKRITVPSPQVKSIYQSLRKSWVRVEYIGPKQPVFLVELPSYFTQKAVATSQNIIQTPVSKKPTGNEKRLLTHRLTHHTNGYPPNFR